MRCGQCQRHEIGPSALAVDAASDPTAGNAMFFSPRLPEELAQFIERKKLDPVIDRVFPFAEIKEAFAYPESGHTKGKVVVRMLWQ